MTPKVSCLNFGVQSLFDSKSSNVKKLTKISGGKVWSDHPYMVGGGGIWGSKTPKVSCTKLGMLFQNNAQMSKLKELTKISGSNVWSDHFKLTVLLLAIL